MMRFSLAFLGMLLLSTGVAAGGFKETAVRGRGLRKLGGLAGSLKNYQNALLNERPSSDFAMRLEEASKQHFPDLHSDKKFASMEEAIRHLTAMKENSRDMDAVAVNFKSAVDSLRTLMIVADDKAHPMYRHRRAAAVATPMTLENLQKSIASITDAYEAGNADAVASETGSLLAQLETLLNDLFSELNSMNDEELAIRMRNAENEAPDLAASAYVAIEMLESIAARSGEISEGDVSAMQGQQILLLGGIGVAIGATALWLVYINSEDNDD